MPLLYFKQSKVNNISVNQPPFSTIEIQKNNISCENKIPSYSFAVKCNLQRHLSNYPCDVYSEMAD